MVIYADLVFLLNSVIDFLLLWLTSGIRKQRVPIWRLIVAAIIGGLYATCYLWTAFAPFYTLLFKLLVSLIMIVIAFGFSHPAAYLRNVGVFYLTCIICGGALVALHYLLTGTAQITGGALLSESSVSWFLVLIAFPFIWVYTHFTFRSIQQRSEIDSFLTSVRIQIADHTIECIGLVDTGNQLRDPISRAPVMMVELDQLRHHIPSIVIDFIKSNQWQTKLSELPIEWMARLRIIPYRAAGFEGEMMIAFRPDAVCLWRENNWHNAGKVIIGIDVGRLSTDGTYQALIHPSCMSMVV
ncbi:sporulation factor SpoIIGA. Unknown type peptidase. MEROPS family U04 [Seinonella peptonophila]|uniref:Sporulation sigma-E factor-processing peptidase n=1 Tax=Seinonella peptonophila TaxID=112248 RepID=A0A1M4UZA3_9BACL|nr:sigma-E processing peptidase SpoIIGA [Seinonella peptonophila]SHE61963.1 sporulation factor SpoIIGA. Unknown type peptidase. MEROPS family U04 [Seinonella peptonophila]